MSRELLRKPSIAVAAWGVLVLGLFAWRGDLGLDEDAGVRRMQTAHGNYDQPVIVRRKGGAAIAAASRAMARRSGRVFDSMGFLLVGAEIVPGDGAACRTDADGGFELQLDAERAADVLVRAEGRRAQWRRTSANSPDQLLIRMEPLAPWDSAPQPPAPWLPLRGEGSVVGIDGKPLANAFVNVRGSDCWGRTDDIGRVVLPLPMRRATFIVHGHGAASVSETFVASRPRGVVPLPTLTTDRAGSIHGTVRDERGQGIAGLPVEIRGAGGWRYVETGPGGNFAIGGLVPEQYEVEPFAYRGAIGNSFTLRVDREVVSCDLQLRRVEEANVRVVDESGAAAAGVWVAASLNGLRRGVGQANAEGLINLPVAGGCAFEVRRDGTFVGCEVRDVDVHAEPATIVIAQP